MSDCRYCKDITVCAICGKGYAEAVRAPCTVCGTSYMEHGSYPTCASHPYSADGRCGHVGTFADGMFTGEPCAGAECKNGCVRAVKTKTYSDGTTATGPAPLPLQSPTQQEHVVGLVEDYGQWMWDAGYMDDPRGETLVDDAAQRRKEIRDAVDAAQSHAYAEGRSDEREAVAQLCHEEAANMRKEGEGCKDARYDWMAQGAEALADALRGINSATGKPADPILAAGWLPIESAPEDEHILIATTGGHIGTAYWTNEGDGVEWAWGHPERDYGQCLHPRLKAIAWMPLPKHPEPQL